MSVEKNVNRLVALVEEIAEIVEDLERDNFDVEDIRQLIDQLHVEVEYLADQ